MADPITIDGAFGEGGGQIIRTGLALAALTGRPLELVRIRAGRTRPGLQAQHLTAVRAAQALCDARVEGAEKGSGRLVFEPMSPVRGGLHRFAIGTAGATTLVAQTALPPLMHAGGGRIVVEGGTHVAFAPTADYLAQVFAPALAACGLTVAVSTPRPGFFPRGAGVLEVAVEGGRPTPLVREERGALRAVRAHVVTARLPTHVAARGVAAVREALAGLGVPVEAAVVEAEAACAGAAITLVAESDAGPAGFSALGEQGKPMEAVAAEAVAALRAWLARAGAVDEHLADQLVPVLALADGESRWTTWPVTDHLRTVLHVVQAFLPVEATLGEGPDGVGHVTLRGISP
jgi:RNA 3'-terminal phosphate cyclase (ATP)